MTTGARPAIMVGETFGPVARRVTQDQIDAYAEASGDHNPIHLDPDFARAVGLPGTIAHGMLGMGILAEGVSRWAGGSRRLLGLACRFSRPLLPGDTLICSGRVSAVDETAGTAVLEVEAMSDRGERVLTNGRAVVLVPGRGGEH